RRRRRNVTGTHAAGSTTGWPAGLSCETARASANLGTSLCSPGFGWLHLVDRALFRLFVRTPAQKLCAVSKAAAGEVVILEFAHQAGLERNPFGVAVVTRPSAGTSGSFAGKAACPGGGASAAISGWPGNERL